MKIKHYFGLAVIAAMTASCSSNEDLGTAGPGTGTCCPSKSRHRKVEN